MRNERRCDSKQKYVFLKVAVSCLLVGVAIRILLADSFSSFTLLSVVHTHTPSPIPSFPSPPPHSLPSPNPNPKHLDAVKCDLFVGDWVADPSAPMYTNDSCRVMDAHQNCITNGRPDSGYLYWRWNPRGCQLPKFSPNKFLHIMRDKSWAFIGDSISRNHVESLLCILSQVEVGVEVYHDEEYRSKTWKFPSYNFTLSVIWSPLLMKADIFEDMNGVSSKEIQLYLDTVDDKWANQYKNFDYVVIAGGKWFLKTAIYHENNMVTGCHNCHGKNLTEVEFQYVYHKVLKKAFEFMANSEHKAVVFFRTTTPEHFEYGEWFNGGHCNRTVPFKEGQINLGYEDSIMRDIELEEFRKAQNASAHKFKLLDTSGLSLLRPDGHPGPFRQFHPLPNATVQNDCLHWCLPGPIDSWNDILLQMLTM
ncbi:protein trichome birefringence-like 26 [Cajanus cajan]|nr:protein trichome birefringence-like 26 [Cajanus cajan]